MPPLSLSFLFKRESSWMSFLLTPLLSIRKELGQGHTNLRSPLERPLSTWGSIEPRVGGRQYPCPLPHLPCWILS